MTRKRYLKDSKWLRRYMLENGNLSLRTEACLLKIVTWKWNSSRRGWKTRPCARNTIWKHSDSLPQCHTGWVGIAPSRSTIAVTRATTLWASLMSPLWGRRVTWLVWWPLHPLQSKPRSKSSTTASLVAIKSNLRSVLIKRRVHDLILSLTRLRKRRRSTLCSLTRSRRS